MEDKISELEQLRSENEQLKKKLNEARYLPFNLNVFKKALNNISDSVLIMSTDRIILFTNDSFNKTFGYQNEDIIGKHASVVYGEKISGEKYDEIYKTILATGW